MSLFNRASAKMATIGKSAISSVSNVSIGQIGAVAGAGVIGASYIAKKSSNALLSPGSISRSVSPTGMAQGYGKRGTNANRLNTQGLVQGLYGNRRR